MDDFLSDCRHGLRLYARTPAASSIAVIVLAVAMAFVGAFVSLFVDLSSRSVPGIEDSERLVTVSEVDGNAAYRLELGVVQRFARELASLEALVAMGEYPDTPVGRDGRTVNVEIASRGFFDGIRPRLLLGRGFAPAEHDANAARVAVISERYWHERYNGDSAVIGGVIELYPPLRRRDRIDGPAEFRIVGVMAPEMRGVLSRDVDVWVPLEQIFPHVYGPDAVFDFLPVRALGRLRPGVTTETFLREVDARFPGEAANPGARFDAVNDVVRDIRVYRNAKRQLQLFLAGSILLALVAAANVSLFLLARAPARRRELSIRVCIGAPMTRIVRQLATEAALLVVVSAMLGLILSVWLAGLLREMAFFRSADWGDVTLLDWRVLGLLGAFLVVLALLVSIAPILGLQRDREPPSSRHTSARATAAQRVAATTQVAVAGTFAGAAIAFVWFLAPMTFGNPGYEVRDRHLVLLWHPIALDPTLAPRWIAPEGQREIVEAVPGVEAATLVTATPGLGLPMRSIVDPSDPSRELVVGHASVDSKFIDVLGLRLLHGRAPRESDDRVSLVNVAFARRLFRRTDVVGETLVVPGDGGIVTTIIGVLEDLPFGHPAAAVEPAIFVHAPPERGSAFQVIVRSSLPSTVLWQQLQRLYDSGRLELVPRAVTPLSEFRNRQIAPDRARGLLIIGTACLVVLIAALGFYGTQRYLVGAGQREYAIRASLGAAPTALGSLVLRRSLSIGMPGVVLGALLAFTAVAWLRNVFVSPAISPLAVTAAVVMGLTMLIVAASVGPARIARGTLPAELLRES